MDSIVESNEAGAQKCFNKARQQKHWLSKVGHLLVTIYKWPPASDAFTAASSSKTMSLWRIPSSYHNSTCFVTFKRRNIYLAKQLTTENRFRDDAINTDTTNITIKRMCTQCRVEKSLVRCHALEKGILGISTIKIVAKHEWNPRKVRFVLHKPCVGYFKYPLVSLIMATANEKCREIVWGSDGCWRRGNGGGKLYGR